MRAMISFAVVVILTAAGAGAAAPLPADMKPPKRWAPTFLPVVAADTTRGEVAFESHQEVMVPVQVTRYVEKDGRRIPVTATEYRTVIRTETHTFSLGSYKVFTADGKPVLTDDLAKRIVPGAVLLVAWDGELPEPAYLKLFKPDTVILVAKTKPGEPGGFVYPPPSMPPIEPKKQPEEPKDRRNPS